MPKRWLAVVAVIILMLTTISIAAITQISAVRQRMAMVETVVIDTEINELGNSFRAAGAIEPPPPPPPAKHKFNPVIEFLLDWDFINALFIVIMVVEFVVFPGLFWLWFGPGSSNHTETKKDHVAK